MLENLSLPKMPPSMAALTHHLQALHFHQSPSNYSLSSQLSFTPSSVSSTFFFLFSSSTSTKQLHNQHLPLNQSPIITSPSDDNTLFSISSVLCPSLAYANAYFYKPGYYNVQIVASEDEPEGKLINRFRKEVFKAGVLKECRRRRFFETNQEKRKRKTRDAARRYRKRRPQAERVSKEQVVKKEGYKSEEDCWEFQDVELP